MAGQGIRRAGALNFCPKGLNKLSADFVAEWPSFAIGIWLVIVVGALVALCRLFWFDLVFRRLPNLWVGVFALLFPLGALVLGFNSAAIWHHLLVGFVALTISSFFFIVNWLGGGDVKLWGAVMLWAGPQIAFQTFIVIGLAGAIVGLVSWAAEWLLKNSAQTSTAQFIRLLSAGRGIPYGLALTTGGIYVLSAHTTTFVSQLR